MKKSKGYVSFLNKITHFNADLEVIDIIVENAELMKSDEFLFVNVNPNKHKELAGRKVSSTNRNIALNHLKKTVYSSYIKDLYEEVTEYLKYILKNYAVLPNSNVNRLVGEHNFKCSANDILNLSSYEDVVGMVTDSIFQQLENEKSTLELLKKIKSKLGLDIEEAQLEQALPFLLVRHYLVHSDGKIPSEIYQKYQELKIDKFGYVILSYTFIKKAKNKVANLIKLIDSEIYNKGYLPQSEYNPNTIKG